MTVCRFFLHLFINNKIFTVFRVSKRYHDLQKLIILQCSLYCVIIHFFIWSIMTFSACLILSVSVFLCFSLFYDILKSCVLHLVDDLSKLFKFSWNLNKLAFLKKNNITLQWHRFYFNDDSSDGDKFKWDSTALLSAAFPVTSQGELNKAVWNLKAVCKLNESKFSFIYVENEVFTVLKNA